MQETNGSSLPTYIKVNKPVFTGPTTIDIKSS